VTVFDVPGGLAGEALQRAALQVRPERPPEPLPPPPPEPEPDPGLTPATPA
jgi:hypothetical protein